MKNKLLAASMAFWSLFVLFGLRPGHLNLTGTRSDAPAHVDSTILFLHRGFDVYRRPLAQLARRSASPEALELSSRYEWPTDGVTDLLDLPERAGKPPLMVNWSYIPRPYPPGVFLYFLPIALLKEALGLGPKAVSTSCLLQLLAAAHAFLWLFVSAVWPPKGEDDDRALTAWVLLPLVYCETLLWTMHGFYDAAAMIPMLLAALALRKRRGLQTVFWAALSLFLHFRGLWYLPLLGAGAWLFVGGREYARLARKERAMLVACAAMLGLSAYAFVLVYPWLMTLQPTNYFFMTPDPRVLIRLAYLLLPLGLVGGALALNRSWLPLACIAWTTVMLCRSPFLQMWHSWYLTPLFAMTGLGERPGPRGRALLLLAYLVLAAIAFTYFPFNGILIQDVVRELWG